MLCTIYLITSPSGKKYVGQTTQSFNRRMITHKSAAKNLKKKDGCRALNNAIRKYGWTNMKKEELDFCEADELDELEQAYIEHHNTMYPYGYNLISGGNSNKKMSVKTKELQRQAALERDSSTYRTNNLTKDWPKYLGISDGKIRISKHPKCSCKTFNNPLKSFEENLEDAKLFLEQLNNGDVKVTHKRSLPKGLQKMGDGYRVAVNVNGKLITKRFGESQMSRKTKYKLALEYLEQLV